MININQTCNKKIDLKEHNDLIEKLDKLKREKFAAIYKVKKIIKQ